MARRIEFSKFKIIECTAAELMSAYGTSVCMCDYCGKPQLGDDLGYYIAVLNKWYCKECFEDFKGWAKWYAEDAPYENRNFDKACELFYI